MAKRKTSWRMWAIVCEGVGPINRHVHVSRASAAIDKKHNFEGLDLYSIKRVKVTLDPEKKRRL